MPKLAAQHYTAPHAPIYLVSRHAVDPCDASEVETNENLVLTLGLKLVRLSGGILKFDE